MITPKLPLRTQPSREWKTQIVNDDGWVANAAENRAEYIVMACNYHDRLRDALSEIAGFAVGNGDVCEVIARRARKILAELAELDADSDVAEQFPGEGACDFARRLVSIRKGRGY